MSSVAITIVDLNLVNETWTLDAGVSAKLNDDGLMTAAALTALYVSTIYHTEEFKADCFAFGQKLVEQMKAMGVTQRPTVLATVSVNLEDKDLKTGRMSHTLTASGYDETGNTFPTPAQIVGLYISNLLHDMTFQMDRMEFARDLVAKNSAVKMELINPDSGPTSPTNDDNDAARCAA